MAKKLKKIKIKPSHRGLFGLKAKRAGKSTQEYASEKYNAPGILGEEARFAKNFGKLHGHS